MNWITKLLINSVSVFAGAYLLPGVEVENYWSALLVALVLSILNVSLKPILILFTLPATIFTFGFFLIVINAIIILVADWMIGSFEVNGFWWAMLFSILIWAINMVLEKLFPQDKDKKKPDDSNNHRRDYNAPSGDTIEVNVVSERRVRDE